ncbi:DUF3383 domain-containing protein [Bordetella avium]|uniref:DUF3383 domain-containing protein n=1 Tax=Bordetella avium TaxID=521 RepID=UPI000E69C4F6|nr:DUF3383 domain-containing protein [Bordetella avium]RIQ51056.1 DUF3383 domain-containing protein [Bordetella avium]
MSIKMSRYVRIISSVSGANAVAQRQLVGRRFTTDPRVPVGKIVSVKPGGAEDYFGSGSPEAAFALQYFSYISPAPASQAPELQFAAYPDVARPGRVYGYRSATTLQEFKEVLSGNLSVNVGENAYVLTGINLSAATSLTNVAQLVTAAIAAAANEQSGQSATVSYDALTGAFTVVSAVAGPGAVSIQKAAAPDIGDLMALQGPQAIQSPGSAVLSPLEAFRAVENVTDSFGSASFCAAVALADALPLAEYVSGENVKYQMYWPVSATTADQWSAALLSTASNGLILNGTAGEYKESIPMAVLAATDYTRANATINYMFRQPGVTMTADVSTDPMADFYDARRVNYYGQTANAGQSLSFFQRGYLMGGATAPLDMSVHANEQWLKAYLTSEIMSLFLTVGRIPANNDGKGMVMSLVQGGVDKGLRNGTVVVGKTLTALQKVAIGQMTNDPLAWHDVQNKGYWHTADVTQSTDESGATEYAVKYLLVYSKGDMIRKVEGSHNLI